MTTNDMTTEGPRSVRAEPTDQVSTTAVIAALDELLEAERAGARVTMPATTDPGTDEGRALVAEIHRDETRWCRALMAAIRRLDATPGSRTGAFYEKATGIADVDERLRFLNRGQAWVVRRLEALLPRLDDPVTIGDLTAMLEAHRTNIARTEAWLASRG